MSAVAPPNPVPAFLANISYGRELYQAYETVNAIFWSTLMYLRTNNGAKNLLIKVPEAVHKVAHRYEHSTALPAQMLKKLTLWMKPLNILAPCTKAGLAFADVGAKFYNIFEPVKAQRHFVVLDKNGDKVRASYKFEKWEQWLNKGEVIAHWILSLSESEAGYRKIMNAGPARLCLVTSIVSPLVSLKTLYTEGSFLYKAMWRDADNRHTKYTTTNPEAHIAPQEVYGSFLKITMAVLALSLDVFNRLAPKENKPVGLETAMFWASIAPTFVGLAAHHYWPELVITPLHKEAGLIR